MSLVSFVKTLILMFHPLYLSKQIKLIQKKFNIISPGSIIKSKKIT
jgi:hypothetical protein